MQRSELIRTGDHVFHRPSEETWVVAWADHATGYMAPCGWPTCEARISDCELRKRASDDECARLADDLTRSGRSDAHKAIALLRALEAKDNG